MDEREGLPLSGHCPAVPQPTQLGGELTILVDDALSADSGPLSTCALKQRFTLKKRSMVRAGVVLLLPDEIAAEIVEKFETAFEKV
jgi:hypothetical protein